MKPSIKHFEIPATMVLKIAQLNTRLQSQMNEPEKTLSVYLTEVEIARIVIFFQICGRHQDNMLSSLIFCVHFVLSIQIFK